MKTILTTLTLLLMSTAVFAQQLAEEARIKAVLEGHTKACMDKDAEKAVSYFAHSPHVAITYQAPGTGYIRGYENVCKAYREVINGVEFLRDERKLYTSEYLFSIHGKTAWVTYVEIVIPANGGDMERTHKACYLEKTDDAWKMVGNFWMAEIKSVPEVIAKDQ